MIEIKAIIVELPDKQAVTMELVWDNRKPHTRAERAFADGLIKIMTEGPKVEGINKIGGFMVHRPDGN